LYQEEEVKSLKSFKLMVTALLVLLSVLLVACTAPATPTEEAATEAPTEAEATEAPTEADATEAPTEATEAPTEAVAECDEPVFFFAPAELSGAGATTGTNWKDGATIAIDEINASGGLLGCQIEVEWADTQTDPAVSKAVIAEGLEKDPYVILGPLSSGSIIVNMVEAQRAEVFQIVGGEAANLTEQGNPFIFRTSFGQSTSMPKLANYLETQEITTIDVISINNDFGKGGHDAILPLLEERGIEVINDVSVEEGQADFAPEALTVLDSDAEAVFIYVNEEEAARLLTELSNQGFDKPIYGETVLIAQSVIDLAGEAANGAKGHVGLTAAAPLPLVEEYAAKFEAEYGRLPDHNGMKGYIAVYVVKAMTERLGVFDSKALAEATHCTMITTEEEPGVLIDVVFDEKGNVDRESFLVEVIDGLSTVIEVLPRLGTTCGEE
jgi:branched-chain amino acid transport system substrate-binding protein